ncbi:major tail structural protein [Stenotrophomonas phage vB_SmaS-AXL_1]|uniref:major tail structural protein n=1 Tax=Stenotrophomonas phage vB_SmaS-AXL_1 TaxID=2909581 RepID=UPI002409DE67|nr:major tail structural protein [Stenotrophomonas phage vB_SmaS-AXL_1]UIS24743.1 major tail structural protein [Stenotrophomonas phage vB_SmaS-AXL_1]
MANGSRHSMRYVAETVYGQTPATPAFKPIRHTGTTLGLSKESLQSEEIRDDRQIADFRHGARQVGGDINFELSFESLDDLLEAVTLGSWIADGAPGGEGDRLKAGTQRRSFTIERFFGDIATVDKPYHRFTGVEMNTLALAISANAMITGTLGTVGSDMSTASAIIVGATYAAPTTTSPLDSFTGTLNEAGVPIAVITEIQLNLENGLEARFVVGSKKSILPSIGRSNVSGTITAYFENSLLLDKFINETESSIVFELPDGAGNKYVFTLPRIKYNGGQPDVEGEGPITLSMPFQALLDSTTQTNIIIDRVPA